MTAKRHSRRSWKEIYAPVDDIDGIYYRATSNETMVNLQLKKSKTCQTWYSIMKVDLASWAEFEAVYPASCGPHGLRAFIESLSI